jgi:subtilisin family serine protease
MKLLTIITALLLLSAPALGKQIRVAVVDTGFSGIYGSQAALQQLCKKGHHDFSTGENIVGYDKSGHGSYVATIITKETEHKDYCMMILKVFGSKSGKFTVSKAIKKAVKNGATIINLSLELLHYSEYDKKVFKWATKKGIKIFAAAGNKGQNLNKFCNSYPSCYKLNDNLVRVGALDVYDNKADYSNYGMSIAVYKFGEYDERTLGTSFAAPRAVASYLNELRGK